MFNNKNSQLMILLFLLSQALLSQFIFQGDLKDNGSGYLGDGAEPVENALVSLIDQGDSSQYYCDFTDQNGHFEIQVLPTGVREYPLNPDRFQLMQNYPNPFNPSTIIGYELAEPCHVKIEVYNIAGQKVKTLLDHFQNTSGSVIWQGTNDEGKTVTAGIYIYIMQVMDKQYSRKMLLMDGGSASTNTIPGPVHNQQSKIKTVNKNSSSSQFILKITGENILPYEQLIEINDDVVHNAITERVMTGNDGRVYRIVKIGSQWWMAENLKETMFCNGDSIPNIRSADEWMSTMTAGYSDYDGSEDCADYGYLYNWYAIGDQRGIAPAGWHVPNDEEWKELESFLGAESSEVYSEYGRQVEQSHKLKETGTEHWVEPNTAATNESGFTALPGGFRCDGYLTGPYLYYEIHESAYFWSSTEGATRNAWYRNLNYNSSSIFRLSTSKGCGYSIRLIKDREDIPRISTAAVGEITTTTAECGGIITSTGGSAVILSGMCWSTNPTPKITHNTTTDGTLSGSYTSVMTGLNDNTTYYVRAYATNVNGTGYGDIKSFKTSAVITEESLIDMDGNVYRTVEIGNQVWMLENLKVTHYRNGDPIPRLDYQEGAYDWRELTTGAYGAYDNNDGTVDTCGYYYNWYAVNDERNIAPEGWHVPALEEWKELGDSFAKIKDFAVNECGGRCVGGQFSGMREPGEAAGLGSAIFWSSTAHGDSTAWFREFYTYPSGIYNYGDKAAGFTIRCVRDE